MKLYRRSFLVAFMALVCCGLAALPVNASESLDANAEMMLRKGKVKTSAKKKSKKKKAA